MPIQTSAALTTSAAAISHASAGVSRWAPVASPADLAATLPKTTIPVCARAFTDA